MKSSTKVWLAALSLMSFGVVSEAQESVQYRRAQQAQQQAPQQGLTRDQQAVLDKQDQDIAQVALQIVHVIDQNKAGEVWDAASPAAQKIITRQAFIDKVARDRGALGVPSRRMPMGARHLRFDGTGGMPAGAFVNIMFDTQFSQAPQSTRENVTFILERDQTWRFVGYSLR